MPHSKSCFDCKNACIFEDMSVGIQAYLDDCKQGDKPEVKAFFDAEEGKTLDESQMAEQCQYFDPHLVATCSNCKQPINKPEYSWELWVSGYFDALPVCSEKCKTELQVKCDKEIEEMKTAGW